jgi:hypothetical protein
VETECCEELMIYKWHGSNKHWKHLRINSFHFSGHPFYAAGEYQGNMNLILQPFISCAENIKSL